MRRLVVLCIVSFALAAGCATDRTPEGGGRTAEDSQPLTQNSDEGAGAGAGPLDRSVEHAARRASVLGQEAATPPSPVPGPQDRKLIREGRATLEVASVDATLARLHDLTRQAGGYSTSETRSRDYQRVNQGKIECRAPADKLDSMTAALKSLGTVESLTLSASDITEEYFDLEMRLRNQRALETRLLALVERPTNKLSDLLEAERELARVRGEIDQMEGRRRYWENRVALSALSVSVHEPVPTVGGRQGGAFSVLRKAFAESANNFVSAIAGIIAMTGGLVPDVIALSLVGWVLLRVWRWRRDRRAATQAVLPHR
jgi:Domain of unknown function (DUF4349)